MEILPRKACEAKALSIAYYFNGKPCKHGHISKRWAHNSTCYECVQLNSKKWARNNPKKRAAIAHRYNSTHQAENYKRALKWRQVNPDSWDSVLKRYRKRNANIITGRARDRRRLLGDQLREAARKRYAADSTKKRRSVKRWQDANPDYVAERRGRRKEIMLAATPLWLTPEQRAQIRAIYLEAKRLTKETGVIYSVDHIKPLIGKNSCGLHVPWNLQILTLSENAAKGNRE